MIQGNIQGVRESLLEELEKLYDAEFGREEFLPGRLLNLLVRFTQQMNREIMVYLTREGSVLEVAVGSIASVGLPNATCAAIGSGSAAFAASIPTPEGTPGCLRWTSRRCGFCALTPCAPWACPTAGLPASAPPFWRSGIRDAVHRRLRPCKAGAGAPAPMDAGN